jgi:hypothetical protein
MLRDGWIVEVLAKQVEKPGVAPGLSIDLLLTHKQQQIRFRKENRKRNQCMQHRQEARAQAEEALLPVH